ncbi:DUF2007 domain-containing protein [soil metagenome]
MKELLRTNDIVLLSYVGHLLSEAAIDHTVFDAHISAVEGSIGAFPRRVMVAEDDLNAARRILGNASITTSQ